MVQFYGTSKRFGIFDHHPVFNFKMPWWFRGPIAGASFMLMYVLFTYDTLIVIIQSPLFAWMGLTSPFWAIIDGIIIGGIMGFVETKIAGEGKNLPIS